MYEEGRARAPAPWMDAPAGRRVEEDRASGQRDGVTPALEGEAAAGHDGDRPAVDSQPADRATPSGHVCAHAELDPPRADRAAEERQRMNRSETVCGSRTAAAARCELDRRQGHNRSVRGIGDTAAGEVLCSRRLDHSTEELRCPARADKHNSTDEKATAVDRVD